MNKQSIYASAAVIVAALLVFISIGRVNFYTGWIAFMPLFACVINTPSKKCFRLGLLFGAAFSCFAYAWMITGAQRFTGYHFLYGLGVMLFVYTVCFALLGLLIVLLFAFATTAKACNGYFV